MKDIRWAQAAEHLPLTAFRPNPKNPKKHTKAQIGHIRESILRFGFLDPIGVWGDGNIVVEGHGRLEALTQLVDAGEIALPEEGVPCIRVDHLSKRDRDAYMLEHNQSAMETGWDDDALEEVLGDIGEDGLDMSVFGFEIPGETDELDAKYATGVNVPQYEPHGERPNLADLCDTRKQDELLRQIEQSGVPEAEKAFLRRAAGRHAVFHYAAIAEYYAQASPEMQRLMEASALVIIDAKDAIAGGFAVLRGELLDMIGEPGEDDGDDA